MKKSRSNRILLFVCCLAGCAASVNARHAAVSSREMNPGQSDASDFLLLFYGCVCGVSFLFSCASTGWVSSFLRLSVYMCTGYQVQVEHLLVHSLSACALKSIYLILRIIEA